MIFFVSVINKEISSTISTLERQDRESKFLEELLFIGAISNEYYIKTINGVAKNINKKIDNINEVKQNLQKWEDLTRNEKIKSVKYSVKRIDISVENKEVLRVHFYNDDQLIG